MTNSESRNSQAKHDPKDLPTNKTENTNKKQLTSIANRQEKLALTPNTQGDFTRPIGATKGTQTTLGTHTKKTTLREKLTETSPSPQEKPKLQLGTHRDKTRTHTKELWQLTHDRATRKEKIVGGRPATKDATQEQHPST